MIIDSLKDVHKLETKTLHDKLERKKSKILNIKQESDIIQVDYERLKSQSKQEGKMKLGNLSQRYISNYTRIFKC